MNGTFLEHIKIRSFGAFSQTAIGPFTSGLNVVFGRNEAGKTTLASFVGGVLFGWEEARGNRNTYKPENTERSGSLFFNVEGEEVELSRTRNIDGLKGDASLIADIDKETFRTMFALTSDELRDLRNTTDVTAKLLTAGSGTGASPAHALADVQTRLAEYTSRASSAEHSLVNLMSQLDELRARIAQAAEEAERFKRQDREFAELSPQRDDLNNQLAKLNAEIEELTAQRAAVEKLDHERAELQDQIDALFEEEAQLSLSHEATADQALRNLVLLQPSEERIVRDRLEALSVEETKFVHAVDLAQDNVSTSVAAYEALVETSDADEVRERARRQRRVQMALSIVLPLMFIVAGVPLFIHGRDINSLSFSALGAGLVFFAVMLAFGAMVMLFRPNKETEAHEARKQDAQWVMLQDQKKLKACQQALDAFHERVTAQLEADGLAQAQGSLRRARTLLDEAKDVRATSNLQQQRQQALISRRGALEDRLTAAQEQRARIFARVALRDEATLEALDALLEQKVRQREGLLGASEGLNRRYGELKQELTGARTARDFDALRLRYEQVRTRQKESAREYARLLLARRMLETAIAAWESKSQPEVYRQASRLLSMMTEGRWVKVDMTPEGRLQVVDAVKTVREPLHLSLGTCQQLYLALRIALLMTADNVGCATPILADDILVNFDAVRRVGAARALAELAQVRQVILFTCHEEIVETVRQVDAEATVITL